MNLAEQAPEPSTILIVDDAKLNRELLRLHLAKHGYRFMTAVDGREAVEILSAHPEVDLILLDLMMPGMNGFDFLHWRADHAEAQAIPVIVNSSLDDFDSIARALNMDTYDYFTKPLAKRDLEVVLPLKIHNAVNTRRLVAETRRQNELMRADLEMAARYQQFLLPRQVDVRGAQVAYLFQPCRGVGGDYFDFLELPSGQVAFIMADVAGHGVASAMTASIVKAIWPGLLAQSPSPALAFQQLNADLLRLTQEDVFVTAFGALYDPARRALTWSLAGHPAPLFFPWGEEPVPLAMQSVFLGIFENDNPLAGYDDQERPVKQGDRLLLYTDGLTEAPGAGGGMYGLERLCRLVWEHRSQDVRTLREIVWDDLNSFVQGEFPDDVAFIIAEF